MQQADPIPVSTTPEPLAPAPAGGLWDRPEVRRMVIGGAGVYAVWLLLASSLDPAEWLLGLLVAALTAWVSAPRLTILDGLRLTPQMPLHVLKFLGVFLRALLLANLDLGRRVLSPRLPIRPAVVEVETALTSRLGRLLLANSITLTPGTLTVDVVDQRLEVHWIDVTPGRDLASATRAIAADFERHLAGFLK